MTFQTIQIIIVSTIACCAFFLGREVYRRSMRVKRHLQMEKLYTDITHELLTPLTVLSASVDHLRDQEPRFVNDYDLMQLNIHRMVRLLQQILETSKSHAGELKLLVANGDVMKYIHETARCLHPLLSKKGLTFSIECHPESMMGWIDTDKLDKIIYNLLSNAAKYTPNGGKVSLCVNTNKTYDKITISVSDTGSGIPKEKLKHLFDRFYDGEYRQHKTIGHGLGLSLTRELVDLHHGSILCDSKEGEGTVFTVVLPITKEAFKPEQIYEDSKINVDFPRDTLMPLQAITPNYNEMEDDADDTNHTYRILVVEDHIELLMLMRHLLRQYYQVYIARNGREAIDLIAKTNFDLIISDIMMPEMDGLELTRTLKEDSAHSHLPIILLTAKTQEEDREEALKTGADDYLPKPFRLSDLKMRIDNIIANRKRIQTDYRPSDHEAAEEIKPLTPEEEFLQKATACVYSHLEDSDYSREAFAADMGASTSTLYNKLRAITGLNVSLFIRDIRLKEAYKMAQDDPTMRVSDLAYRVGFQDPKYFSTCFKKQFGVLPKEFMDSLHGA